MILPIYTYGNPDLQKIAFDADPSNEDEIIKHLISDMYETMHNANGSGLAAPQVGSPVKIIVIDAETANGIIFKGVFINPKILSYFGGLYTMTEGCLSLPGIKAMVNRPGIIEMEYLDENYVQHNQKIEGLPARILQHEYDHLIGKLFIDHLDVLSKESILIDLVNLKQKKVKTTYPII